MRTRSKSSNLFLQKAVVVGLALAALGILSKLTLSAVAEPKPTNLLATQVALFVLVGTVIYILLGRATVEGSPTRAQTETRLAPILGMGSVYVIAIASAVWFLWHSLYVPTPHYYLAVSFAVVAVGVQIVLTPRVGKQGVGLILLQIVGLGVLIQVSFPLLNPKSVFSDMYFDWKGIEAIAQSGVVPEWLGFFFYFPSYNILNAIALKMGGIGIGSFPLFNHLLMVLTIPGSYLLARKFISVRQALMATLLITPSLFFMLRTTVDAGFLGLTIMVLALYVLLQYRRTATRTWWVMFWLLTLFLFFSHPVSALIFAVIMGVFLLNSKLHTTSSQEARIGAPTVTYGVAYLGYLAFIALRAFAIFLQALFESGPRVYFARAAVGPAPETFTLQTIMSTLGFTILFIPATFAILFWAFKGGWNRRFLVGILFVVASVPALMVLLGKGEYGLQAGRTLPYLNLFMVFPAAFGFLYFTQRMRRNASKVATVVVFLFLLTFLSNTSYLTGSGNRFLTDTIPVKTSYVTDSMLASGEFLDRIPSTVPLTLDRHLADFIAPDYTIGYPFKAYSINHLTFVSFASGRGNSSVAVALSNLYLTLQGYEALDASFLDITHDVRAYDNGNVFVYAPSEA